MTIPRFDFTARARPLIEMGRSVRADTGNRWQNGTWGTGRWGVTDWEIEWTDLGCEVHEVVVDTGRGGATDRFRPGTATITASNVNRISDMIFPGVPDNPEGFELVPQPPVGHEEDLQTPDAGTVISDGWKFTDDFETAPPRWRFPTAWVDSSPSAAICGPFKIIDGAFEPELYTDDATDGYVACAAAQWTDSFDPDGNVALSVVLTGFDWPAAPTAGSPELRVDLFLRSNHNNRECDVARFRFIPTFPGANTVEVELWHMAGDGSMVDGSGVTSYTVGTGSNGVFGTRTLTVKLRQSFLGDGSIAFTELSASLSGVFTDVGWEVDTPLPAGRIGIWMSWVQGAVAATVTGGPRITRVTGPDFVDNLTRPLGSGWRFADYQTDLDRGPMYQLDGAMNPPEVFADHHGGVYEAAGYAQWTSKFEGDQYVEVVLEDVSVPPIGSGNTNTVIELHTHANPDDAAAMVATIQYNPDGDEIYWQLFQQGRYAQFLNYDPSAEGYISGPGGGVFGEPQRWRVESDLTGEQRLYRNGHLLYTATAPNPPAGDRIAVAADSRRGAPGWPSADPTGRRAGTVRIVSFSGGLLAPLGTEELGLWVRIGIHHTVLGNCWLFRGFVDGLEPSYDPDRPDQVRIDCIDSLGEAGRVEIDGDQCSNPFVEAPDRIRQVLNQTGWPKHFRSIGGDATLMSRPLSGRAVDALTHIAESCGGAVYGDPVTGDLVFKGQDWQAESAGGIQEAFLTNFTPDDADPAIPRVCPTGWERSSQRAEMTTRARMSSFTSDTADGEPVVREWRNPGAEQLYGVEKYARTLLCVTGERLTELAGRQLRLRNPNEFPRIEAAQLDAATADEALDLMCTATFTKPTKIHCQHRDAGEWVFNRRMIVTGVRHRMTPESWTCRLGLDPASIFSAQAAVWGEARWDDGEWGVGR